MHRGQVYLNSWYWMQIFWIFKGQGQLLFRLSFLLLPAGRRSAEQKTSPILTLIFQYQRIAPGQRIA
jgi:hypothetical protein